jgi:GT2 family glycosyltransferase
MFDPHSDSHSAPASDPLHDSECKPDRVIVAIPTYRRPKSLARLLQAIAALETRANILVLVADNDPTEHAGLNLCRSLVPGYRWPLQAVMAHERGIAPARNVLVEHALHDPCAQFIAMIDDDEWPDPGWIDAFLRVAHQTGADVLQGSILFGDSDGHADIRRPTGPIAGLQGAGNLFIRRKAVETMTAPWFDPQFALSGGEDSDFFLRLAHEGCQFAWADDARAFGAIPATRNRLSWMLARAYSIGNSDMRVLLKHRPGAILIAAELGKILGVLLLSPFAAIILAASPNRRLGLLQKMWRAAGKLTALFGARYNEYAVIHGE